MATKKTPEQRLQELQDQEEKLKAELKQRQAKIQRQKRQQQAKLTNEKRKRETRQKVLIGAAVLAKVQSGEWPHDRMLKLLDSYLTRDDDRALFDLPVNGQDQGHG